MKSAVIVFPGSNCDRDIAVALSAHGEKARMVWHKDTALPAGLDIVALPGGFSYGDYLRCGAIAAKSPIMDAVRSFAEGGGLVLGICNGFQVLCEAGLLPGVLMRNAGLKFVCRPVHLKVETVASPYTAGFGNQSFATIPIAHHDGCYIADRPTLDALQAEDRVAFRYVDAAGEPNAAANPNGSLDNIAGILSANRRVLGMMPHPERHADPALGGTDGARLFASLADSLATA
ncbi:MAG: phosphoribosylformylglycinamidine synthase subunit PurQ [Pseudomonadota bacterium]